jgi:hypothetical protein
MFLNRSSKAVANLLYPGAVSQLIDMNANSCCGEDSCRVLKKIWLHNVQSLESSCKTKWTSSDLNDV